MTMRVCRAASHATSRGAASAAHAMTPPIGELSSSSASSDDWREFRELVCGADEAYQRYSNATCEVSRLERCLDAIRVALEASERETIATWAAAIDT